MYNNYIIKCNFYYLYNNFEAIVKIIKIVHYYFKKIKQNYISS